MKKSNRLLVLLMALAMVFAYMPAMVFADDDIFSAGYNGPLVEDLAEAGEEAIATDAKNAVEATAGILIFELSDDRTAALTDYVYSPEALNTTTLTIPATIDVKDMGEYRVTSIGKNALFGLRALTSVTIPPSITTIGDQAIGYYYDGGNTTKDAGLTILGITGTAAQNYASANSFAFRDPVAEEIAATEAVRQGVPDGKIPKVKTSKPTSGKKFIIVKWKKLSKKQLKKSKATHYEVWVCADTGFANGQTSQHIIKKSKAGLKITKVPKGTYYVKVRAIRKVGETKYVGPWSKPKKVKVKK